MDKEINLRKQKLQQETISYKGDDPLHLRYDFLIWLDSTYGKDNCMETFKGILENTLNTFWNEAKYSQDPRFIQLLIFYSELQTNPLDVYTTVYKKGIGARSALWYQRWAGELFKKENYKEADKIINIGLHNLAEPKEELELFYNKFLQSIGKKYLQGELITENASTTQLCFKCSTSLQPKEQCENNGTTDEEVVCWEMNMLKVGDPDTFTCPTVCFEQEDSNKIAMYPKSQVYVGDKEFSLEEILANKYFQKLTEQQNMVEVDKINERKDSKQEESNYFPDGTLINKKEKSALSNTQSYGDVTKEAMIVIQEMWKSPTPVLSQQPELSKPTFEVFNENSHPSRSEARKTIPFTIFTENSIQENCVPNLAQKALTSVKKSQPQPTKTNALSEKKIKDFEPKNLVLVKQQLAFGGISEANEELAEKLGDTSLTEKQPGKKLNFGTIDMHEELSDETCNTKAFAFILPSSTPVHQRKSSALQNNVATTSNNRSYTDEPINQNPAPTQQELSVILEASKERNSSSSSTNSSTNPRTPRILAHTDPLLSFSPFLKDPLSWNLYMELFGFETFCYDYMPFFIPSHCSHVIAFYEQIQVIYNDYDFFTKFRIRGVLATEYEELSHNIFKKINKGNDDDNGNDAKQRYSFTIENYSYFVENLKESNQILCGEAKLNKTTSNCHSFNFKQRQPYIDEAERMDSPLFNISNCIECYERTKKSRYSDCSKSGKCSLKSIVTKGKQVKSLTCLPANSKLNSLPKRRNISKDNQENVDHSLNCNNEFRTSRKESLQEMINESRIKLLKPYYNSQGSCVEDSNVGICSDKVSPCYINFPTVKILDGVRRLNFEDNDEIDPFNPKLTEWLLSQINFPLPYHTKNYFVIKSLLPVKFAKTIKLGNGNYTILGDLGKGAYARVVKAKCENLDCALKIEKPPCKWEYYIAKEIQTRVDPKSRPHFMDITMAYMFQNGSVLHTEWADYGSLLNVISNYKIKCNRIFDLGIIIYFAIQMIDIIESLHKVKIIHGDIKPDNFVVSSSFQDSNAAPWIKLIDFGRSIDMALLPEGTQFKHVVTTDGFQCNEMKENKPWTYQTDLYGLAGSIYCLLAGDYMNLIKTSCNRWKPQQLLPRCSRRELWDPIFSTLLNIKSCNEMPDLGEMKSVLQRELNEMGTFNVNNSLNHLHNVLKEK